MAYLAAPTLAHLSSRENTEGGNVISMRSSRHRQHEIPTCYNRPNLAMLHSKCQLTSAMLLRGFLVRFGGKPIREMVWVALEYPRVTCENDYSWFNVTVDGLVGGLHSSLIKRIPAHCCPACNIRSYGETLKSLGKHVLRRVSYLFGA
jgi:hypothetical protein